jgi:hypothetical protein
MKKRDNCLAAFLDISLMVQNNKVTPSSRPVMLYSVVICKGVACSTGLNVTAELSATNQHGCKTEVFRSRGKKQADDLWIMSWRLKETIEQIPRSTFITNKGREKIN